MAATTTTTTTSSTTKLLPVQLGPILYIKITKVYTFYSYYVKHAYSRLNKRFWVVYERVKERASELAPTESFP